MNAVSDPTQAVARLVARYCHHVDRGPADAIAPLFTADGVLDLGERRLEGRDAIDAFYRDRATRGITSRHVVANLLVEAAGDSEAHVTSTLLLFRELAATTPVIVADYYDRVVLEDGEWRFASKRVEIIFRNV